MVFISIISLAFFVTFGVESRDGQKQQENKGNKFFHLFSLFRLDFRSFLRLFPFAVLKDHFQGSGTGYFVREDNFRVGTGGNTHIKIRDLFIPEKGGDFLDIELRLNLSGVLILLISRIHGVDDYRLYFDDIADFVVVVNNFYYTASFHILSLTASAEGDIDFFLVGIDFARIGFRQDNNVLGTAQFGVDVEVC